MSEKKNHIVIQISRIRNFFSKISWVSILVGASIGLPFWRTIQVFMSAASPSALGTWELALGVVLGGVVGWVIPEFINSARVAWAKSHPLRRVLGPSCANHEPTFIFLGSLYPSETQSFLKTIPLQPEGTMAIVPKHGMPWVLVENDARALGFIMATLASAGKTENVTVIRDDFGLEIIDANMFCIGSIKNNHKTKQINDSFQRLPIIFEWKDGKLVIRSKEPDKIWSTDDVYDYAILAKIPNEYDTSKVVFIIGGISHIGTAGAANYLWRKWPDIVRQSGDKFFTYVLQVRRDNFQYAQLDHKVEFLLSA